MKRNANTLLILIGVVLAGCTTTTVHVTRYTWASAGDAADLSRLRQAGTACLREVNDTYIPNLFGGGAAIKQTLYKDCIERHGYVKTKTEDVRHPADWDDAGKVYRLRPGLICGSDQTCVLWAR